MRKAKDYYAFKKQLTLSTESTKKILLQEIISID